VDRLNLEPGDRMHEGQRWLQKLLRPANVEAVKGDGPTQLPERIHADDARAHDRRAIEMEEAAEDFRQFDVRPLPQGRSP